MARSAKLALVAALALLCVGCSLARGDRPGEPVPAAGGAQDATMARDAAAANADARGMHLLQLAQAQLGIPYRYGGDSPRGFDCSGLVRYVHALEGVSVPRTAAGQMLAAQRVPLDALAPGDLLFFASDGTQVDHVGIYAGDRRFLHAPRTGRPVGYDRLDDDWYAPRLRAAGRFWTQVRPTGTAAPAP
jgi:cell wall-associated NlpC family hydrolase